MKISKVFTGNLNWEKVNPKQCYFDNTNPSLRQTYICFLLVQKVYFTTRKPQLLQN